MSEEQQGNKQGYLGTFILAVIIVIAWPMLFGGDDGKDSASSTPPSTTLYGRVVIVGTDNFGKIGNECVGTGQFSDMRSGAKVTITGRSEFSEATLSAGIMSSTNQCSFRFSAPTYKSTEYMFSFDGGLYTKCPATHVPTNGTRIDASLEFQGDTRYCVRP